MASRVSRAACSARERFFFPREASSAALARGAIDSAGYERREHVNHLGNSGKHDLIERLRTVSERRRKDSLGLRRIRRPIGDVPQMGSSGSSCGRLWGFIGQAIVDTWAG